LRSLKIGTVTQVREKSPMQVFVDSQLERVYNFESFLELGSTNLVMFDEMPDRDIVVCNCKLGEFKTPCWNVFVGGKSTVVELEIGKRRCLMWDR